MSIPLAYNVNKSSSMISQTSTGMCGSQACENCWWLALTTYSAGRLAPNLLYLP